MNAMTPKTFERPISEPVNRRMLTADQIDDLGEAILSLTREVWVLTDRVHVLEAVLESHGVLANAEVDNFQPGPELQAQLNAKRDAIVQNLLRSLRAAPEARS
ncbi:hypothetical protein DMC25_24185 [Caulobacter sp. D4A]|uniref:hypothetical protein n=1 Tax=unclassified Caulobacter TaxID=2648921 RepID=UPI000D72D670|nr:MULTISPECIES: hypothetical protein [unclassified Caulobacter]PXA76013.1 hypothetical protein DMC25_24185 [Caulobacter sp. D4A]PXA86189.1 hypothetical protein DMC18_22175 [Caulobacter sp. D5]